MVLESISTHTHTSILGPFSRTTRVSRCQKKIFSGLLWCKGK